MNKIYVGLTLAISASVAQAAQVPVQVLSATVKDQNIAGATVILQKNGENSSSTTTNSAGSAVVSTNFADNADTLVIIKKAGYSTLVAKCPCQGMTYALSPVMKNLDGMRVVLNWGATPSDLDSHLVYRDNHIYWDHQQGSNANLDVDDTDSYGPETITVEQRQVGDQYVYAVHDFSHRKSPSSNALSLSNARVMVYVGQSLVRSYYVPRNVQGNLWTVFRVTGEGEFQDINTLTKTTLDAADIAGDVLGYTQRSTVVRAINVSAAEVSRAKALNLQGANAYKAGNIELAIQLYQQAVDTNPNNAQAYSNLGLAHQKLGHNSEAIWANRKAIALAEANSPTKAYSFYNIAMIYEGAGQYAQALQNYQFAKQFKANPVYDEAIQRVKSKLR